jgi:hypothetical protein
MKLQDNQSEIAKLVWSKLFYTPCQINGQDSTIIEIKEVWELIKEIETKFETTKKALDFNVKQNLGLIWENHRLQGIIKTYQSSNIKK